MSSIFFSDVSSLYWLRLQLRNFPYCDCISESLYAFFLLRKETKKEKEKEKKKKIYIYIYIYFCIFRIFVRLQSTISLSHTTARITLSQKFFFDFCCTALTWAWPNSLWYISFFLSLSLCRFLWSNFSYLFKALWLLFELITIYLEF